jgi:hypothetical protein
VRCNPDLVRTFPVCDDSEPSTGPNLQVMSSPCANSWCPDFTQNAMTSTDTPLHASMLPDGVPLISISGRPGVDTGILPQFARGLLMPEFYELCHNLFSIHSEQLA